MPKLARLLVVTQLIACLFPGVAALQLRPANRAPLQMRQGAACSVQMQTASGEAVRCALISLSPEDPLRVAKVLKKAWMEGGVKRGLVGSVLVSAEEVKIACQGPVARLQSFADWIETSSMLVTDVSYVESEECPTEGFSSKFKLSDAETFSGGVEGSFKGDLAEKLKTLAVDVEAKQGTAHSNDEGLF